MRGLMVAGTTSGAGKSVVTAGLCRWLARQGVKVAPFKAQNMSLNSMVTADGGEIGRAQAMQAAAARVVPEAAMNPVLLKPGGDRRSHVVVLGRPFGELDAADYPRRRERLLQVVLDSLGALSQRFDAVVCEGAGSPAEVNLRSSDIVNMGLAVAARLPVVVVGDIDRGGVFAHFLGTLAALDATDQRHVAGFIVNKFRGDAALLGPALQWLDATTGRPCLGVLPWTEGLWLDVEDSLDLASRPTTFENPIQNDVLHVAVLRVPRLSNITDVDPLMTEPGVRVTLADSPGELRDADLVILPGTRETVADLQWLRERGLDTVITQRAQLSRPVLGICGGAQMLGTVIDDDVESRAGSVPGLGALPLRTTFGTDKVLQLVQGVWEGEQVDGYQIHHGRISVDGGEGFLDGCRSGSVFATTWHGLFEADGFRRAFLGMVAAASGRDWRPGQVSFAERREERLDALADLVTEHLDTALLWRLLEQGPPPGLPAVTLALDHSRAGR